MVLRIEKNLEYSVYSILRLGDARLLVGSDHDLMVCDPILLHNFLVLRAEWIFHQCAAGF